MYGVQGHHEKRSKKLEVPLESDMPYKLRRVAEHEETCSAKKSRHADNTIRMYRRSPRTLQESAFKKLKNREHEDHIAEREFNSLSRSKSVIASLAH